MKVPSGPGAPAPDAADALRQATAVCSGIRTLTAEVAASGKVTGRRFPFGSPIFILAANNDDTTALLPRDDRVLQHGRSADVLDAVAGVPVGASDLHAVLTGCAPAVSQPEGRALGTDWRRLTDTSGGVLYLRRTGATQPWQLVTVIGSRWRAEFRDHLNGLPRSMRITDAGRSGVASGALFDLTLTLSQVETNVPLGAEVFRVDVPPTARPITLDELRRARPGVREN
jgi:hypothetical protein